METYGSTVVNGQNVPVIGRQAVRPDAGLGPMFTGPGQSPLATIPKSPAGTVGAGAGGVPSALTPRLLFILGGMFIVGVIGLRYVHWK